METRLWRIIERLRGGIDVRDYKHLILPLVFLRSADIDFSKRLSEISKMKHFSGELLPEFFVENGGVYLPDDARWGYLVSCAKEKTSNLSARVDRAFRVIMETNPEVDGLFKDGFYAKKISSEKLSGVILEINKLEKFDLDIVYMYLLKRFSAKESRGKGKGEFYTPASVWEFIQGEIGSNISGKIYDPCIGMGGMILPAVLSSKKNEVEIFGQDVNFDTLKFAKLNFLMQGYKANLAVADTLEEDKFRSLKADFVFCNPPFNLKTKKYKNANFAWVELCISKLSKNGVAVVILPGTALVDAKFIEERRRLVRDNLSAVVNLPIDIFNGVSTPISILIFKNKSSGRVTFKDKRCGEKVKSVPVEKVLNNEIVSLAPSDYLLNETSLRPEEIDFSDEISRKIFEKEMEIRKLRGMLDFSIDWSEISGISLAEIVEEVSSDSEILPGEFAVNLLHVGRDRKLPVVLNSSDDQVAVSKSYFKFRIRKKWSSKLPAEYLLMLLKRPEIAEELAFLSDKSAWGEVSVQEFLKIKF